MNWATELNDGYGWESASARATAIFQAQCFVDGIAKDKEVCMKVARKVVAKVNKKDIYAWCLHGGGGGGNRFGRGYQGKVRVG